MRLLGRRRGGMAGVGLFLIIHCILGLFSLPSILLCFTLPSLFSLSIIVFLSYLARCAVWRQHTYFVLMSCLEHQDISTRRPPLVLDGRG